MRNILRNLLSAFAVCLMALTSQNALAGDALAKYKLNLSDPNVCKVYYMRGGAYQSTEPLDVGGEEPAAPYERLQYLYDGKFVDCRGIESSNVDDYNGENCITPNQGFVVFDFGEKGIDFQKIVLYNDGYYQRHQQGTVFVAFAGPTADGDFTEDCVTEKYNSNTFNKIDLLRTNGSAQKFSYVTNVNNWATGSVDPSENEPGYYATTVNVGNHVKYRYVLVYDWSNYMYLSEVEIYGVLLKNSTYSDKQLDLERAIDEAQSYADEFAMSDEEAVNSLKGVIATAQALLDENVTDETLLAEAGTALKAATDDFMASITYKLGENEFYCTITTASQENGLKLASEKTTVGNYTGYVLQSCLPDEALAFSVAKSSIVNGQQAYQLATKDGVVIQTGSTLMLVDPNQVTASNPAKFVFTMRYSDGENALYDLKAGNFFYYMDEDGSLASTETFPEYESFEEIIPYTFMLTPSEYQKDPKEAEANFKGWEFNEAAKEVTEVYGDKFGLNAGNIVEGWRLNKWRMYTRVGQTEGIMTISVNNPYYANEDTLTLAPVAPAIDENSVLTSANNGAGICRENGKYQTRASRDPIDQIRDSTYLITVNPIYCPYIAVKIGGTDENVDLSGWSFSFFIKKDGIEPSLNLNNAAGHKGDVYYWRLTDCGFTVGQVGYAAQYMGMNAAFQSTKQAVMIDWIRPYESIDDIPEESFTAEQKAAVVATLPENPVYEAPEYEVKKVEYLGQFIKAYNGDNGDLTEAYVDAIEQLTDEDYTTTLSKGTSDVYYVLAVPEAIQKFQSVKVYYKNSGNDYSTNVFFYTDAELNVTADKYGNYVPSCGGLWQHTAFAGDVVKDETNSVVTFTNTNKEAITYIALRGDNDGNPLNATEIELFYYDDGNFEDKPGEGQHSKETAKVLYLSDYLTAVNASNGDETENFKAEIAALTDGDTETNLEAGRAGIYYVISLPAGLKDFQSLKVFYKGGNEYSTNVFFYTAEDLDVAADTYGNYVPSGGGLWMHTGFSGAVEKDEANGVVTFINTTKEQFNYIAIKGDNDGNPLSATEIELYYYLGGEYHEAVRLDPVNYWTLTNNWVSTRKDGSVVVNEDGSMTANAGSDNNKRADIKNVTDEFYVGDHKVIFYVAEPTAAASGVTQNYGDMKFGYTATVAAFDEKAVVNEQLLRGNSSNTQYAVEGGYLVYFDLGNKNANVAYFIGDSGNKFDGATKDSYRAALTEMDDLTITGLNFTLIGSAETGFNIVSMGSAKDVETLLAEFAEVGINGLTSDPSLSKRGEIYNLAGQRMSRLQRGINIVNGKKILVK
ncbi:MAG: hypothetical protein IJQ76_04705 [Prevotella sp.]|nr:hypothetical protein [Prevotella sp.]